MHKAKNNGYIAVGILVATLVLFLGIIYSQINGGKIAKNTYVGDVCIGSLSKEEAKKLLESEVNIGTIELSYLDNKWDINPSDIDASYDIDKTIEKAYNLNRNQNVFENLSKTIKTNFGSKNNLDMVVNYNKEKLKDKLEEIKQDIDVEVKNAELSISGDSITVLDESKGLELDVEASLKKIESQLENGVLSDDLVVKTVDPKVTKEELSEVNTVLGRYTTIIKASSADRIANIKAAAEKMNNYLLMPGDEFSYAGVTGPYTAANGYSNAPVIVEGELQNGIGGGVCQLSSTLYNSVLYSGLEIVQLRNHTIPSSYVPKGRDATVTDSGIDFVFKNNLEHPVYLKSYVSGSSVVTAIYGSSKDKQNIEIQTSTDGVSAAPVKKVDDPSIEKGTEKVLEKGRDGYTVSTYRVYKDNSGNVLNKEKIYTSYYPKKQSVIAVGTKEVKEEVENTTTEGKEENSQDSTKPENTTKPESSTKPENTTKPEENKPSENGSNNDQTTTQ